jgi:hypothetical protein
MWPAPDAGDTPFRAPERRLRCHPWACPMVWSIRNWLAETPTPSRIVNIADGGRQRDATREIPADVGIPGAGIEILSPGVVFPIVVVATKESSMIRSRNAVLVGVLSFLSVLLPKATAADANSMRPRVGIMEFRVIGDVGISDVGRVVAERLLAKFGDRFQLVERNDLDTILKEAGLRSSDLFEATGFPVSKKLKGVQYLVLGSVNKLFYLGISARLVDVNARPGDIVQTAEVVADDARGLENGLAELARILQMTPKEKSDYLAGSSLGGLAPAVRFKPAQGAPPPSPDYRKAQDLFVAEKSLQARAELSRLVFSGKLSEEEEKKAVVDLTLLFEKTIACREIVESDSYVFSYTVKAGDTLEGPRGILRTQGASLPQSMILAMNGIASNYQIRTGQRLKLISGSFHAIVRKSKFAMDIYLEKEGAEKVFVKRIGIGLGPGGSTPEGEWRVAQGSKMQRPPYNDPKTFKRVLYGEEGYPFGKKGIWIGLEGTDERTRKVGDFGIHSTDDPKSIGKVSSMGCVRVADEDIDIVWSVLTEVRSKVSVVP